MGKKWSMGVGNWGEICEELGIKFGDRFKIM